jgi:hypothetical protein
VTYCREGANREDLRLQINRLEVTSFRRFSTVEHRRPATGCDEIAQSNKGALARLSQGSGRDADARRLTTIRLLPSWNRQGPRGGVRLFERYEAMMRPDHIYIAMTMVKHGTLAGAFIFAFKILRFAVHAL